jgi:hypothetical protein
MSANFDTPALAGTVWSERLNSLATFLGIRGDNAAMDISRLFYRPRRSSLDKEFIHRFIPGELCDIWSIPDAPSVPSEDQHKSTSNYTFTPRSQSAIAPHLQAVAEGDRTVKGIHLESWAGQYGARFEIVKALRARRPDRFTHRISGVKYHIYCPFDEEHTSSGDPTGTYLVNASEIDRSGLRDRRVGFTCNCKHNACQGRDRLDFIKRFLELGWLHVGDLTDPQFLVEELNAAGINDFLESMRAKEKSADPLHSGCFSIELTQNLPGVMGSIHRYIMETSHKPQPILALGAAIAMMSAVIGRKVHLAGWYTMPNIYIVNVARSGAGKDRPMAAVKDLLSKAGAFHAHCGAEDISSDSGIGRSISTAGRESQVMVLDEIGYLLNSVNNSRNAPHLADVRKLLLKLYSQNRTIFKSKDYNDIRLRFEVQWPSLSLLGSTTPSMLYEGLTTSDIEGGLLSRFIVFDAGKYDPLPKQPKLSSSAVPKDVIEWIESWMSVLANPNQLALSGGVSVPDPQTCAATDAAMKVFDDFVDDMHRQKQSVKDRRHDVLFARANENAMKFALIRAAACGFSNLCVSYDDAVWATALSRATTLHMLEISGGICESMYSQNLDTYRDVIRSSGSRGVTDKEMARIKKCDLPPKERDAVIAHLRLAKEIEYINVNEGKTAKDGRQIKGRNAYVWIADKEDPDDDGEEGHEDARRAD